MKVICFSFPFTFVAWFSYLIIRIDLLTFCSAFLMELSKNLELTHDISNFCSSFVFDGRNRRVARSCAGRVGRLLRGPVGEGLSQTTEDEGSGASRGHGRRGGVPRLRCSHT
jgi:hypothetical protein